MSETAQTENSAAPARPTPLWVNVARVLLVVAIAGAGYLAWVSLHNGPVAGCGLESGCNKVLQSRWAYWLDVPVSIPALLVYIALFGSTVMLQRRPSPDDERGSWAAIIFLSVVLAGAALWFVGLQVFVIKAFCKFCMTAHICGFAAALLCLKNIPFATDPETPMWSSGSGKRGVPGSAVAMLVVVGLVGVGVLAGGQMLLQKERNVVKEMNPASADTNQVATGTGAPDAGFTAPALGVGPNPRLIAPRLLSLYSNQFQIKLDTVPMIGSPDATNVIVCLFDYTCPHCRALHPMLVEAQRQYGGRLGIVCLPMPISTNCNRFLPAKIHSVPNACEYARLGLAVWRARPDSFRQFDDWMFAPNNPPALEQARQYAVQLTGEARLQAALSDPWVDKQILTDSELHYVNWTYNDTPVMPQLVVGPIVSSGPLNSTDHLGILLNRYLRLPISAGNGR